MLCPKAFSPNFSLLKSHLSLEATVDIDYGWRKLGGVAHLLDFSLYAQQRRLFVFQYWCYYYQVFYYLKGSDWKVGLNVFSEDVWYKRCGMKLYFFSTSHCNYLS
jgi:hypothetical protein